MDKQIKRLDLFLWFEGNINIKSIKDELRDFFQLKGLKPLHAEYGIIEVPEEDIGELPYKNEG